MPPEPAAPTLFLQEAEAHGFTPDNLPALKQWVNHVKLGNMDAAARIEKNLRAFLRGVSHVR